MIAEAFAGCQGSAITHCTACHLSVATSAQVSVAMSAKLSVATSCRHMFARESIDARMTNSKFDRRCLFVISNSVVDSPTKTGHQTIATGIMHSFQVQHASPNDRCSDSIKRMRSEHTAYQPEGDRWFDQENGAPDYRDSSCSFIWDYWHRSGAHKNASKHSATCKFCQHRIRDGRMPRLQEHTLKLCKGFWGNET